MTGLRHEENDKKKITQSKKNPDLPVRIFAFRLFGLGRNVDISAGNNKIRILDLVVLCDSRVEPGILIICIGYVPTGYLPI